MCDDGIIDARCCCNGFIYEQDAHLDRLYRLVHNCKPGVPAAANIVAMAQATRKRASTRCKGGKRATQ